jgi:hypothetical protein
MNNKLKILSSKLREFGIVREAEIVQGLSEAQTAEDIRRMLSEHSRSEREQRLDAGRSDLSEFYENYIPDTGSGVEYSRERMISDNRRLEQRGYSYREPDQPWSGAVPTPTPAPALTPKTLPSHVIKMDVKPGVDFDGLGVDAKKLTSIFAMIAIELGHPPMLITSGFRGGRRQAGAMYNNYKAEGGLDDPKKGEKYLVDLYANDDFARTIAKIFRESSGKKDAVNKAAVYLDANPISAHARGVAIDFRNTPGALEVAREAKTRGYFKGRVGDETNTKRPHVHVRIDSMAQEGLAYLSTAGRGTAVV